MYPQFQTNRHGKRSSEHKLVGSHSIRLPCHCSPSQVDPEIRSWPGYALTLGPCAALNRNPNPNTNVKDTPQAVSQPSVSPQPTICLASRSSKNKVSLWKWQREILLLKEYQQGQSTKQSGPYLKNGVERIRWTLTFCKTSLRLICVPV